ncbi:prealbumin-like fold domain-containing protein [Exiguobacterium acetylicum]
MGWKKVTLQLSTCENTQGKLLKETNGEILITGLTRSTYSLIEMQAPIGYLLDSEQCIIRLKSGCPCHDNEHD